MKKPSMLLFDYGQTLVSEARFDGIQGTKAVLQYAAANKYHLSAEQVQEKADRLNRELGRFVSSKDSRRLQIEIPNRVFNAYLYESLGIRIGLTYEEMDRVFWDAAAPGKATEGVLDFLKYIDGRGIRTGVISNIAYAGQVVEERIQKVIPGHRFEFIIASSEYLYCKPDRKLFDLALEKAGLLPEEVWYIGDQYEKDIVGARNAGIYPVWYLGAQRFPQENRPDDVRKIFHWRELQDYLEEIS